MSSLGPVGIGALNLAGTLAAASRSDPDRMRAKASAAEQQLQVDQKTVSAQTADDVAEAELSSDRDPDGRLLDDGDRPDSPRPPCAADESSDETVGVEESLRRTPDALGERGLSLDLDA